jgi:hypothetical protein
MIEASVTVETSTDSPTWLTQALIFSVTSTLYPLHAETSLWLAAIGRIPLLIGGPVSLVALSRHDSHGSMRTPNRSKTFAWPDCESPRRPTVGRSPLVSPGAQSTCAVRPRTVRCTLWTVGIRHSWHAASSTRRRWFSTFSMEAQHRHGRSGHTRQLELQHCSSRERSRVR